MRNPESLAHRFADIVNSHHAGDFGELVTDGMLNALKIFQQLGAVSMLGGRA